MGFKKIFNLRLIALFSLAILMVAFSVVPAHSVVASSAPRQAENLNRGLVAVKVENGVFVSWRLLGTEAMAVSFNLYRNGVKVNSNPITNSTNYQDVNGTTSSSYTVRVIVDGVEQQDSPISGVWSNNYKDIPIQKPPNGQTPDGTNYTYRANDASVGDLDGDGDYEIVLKWDPTKSEDNSHAGYTGNVYLDAYEMDGTQLWRINLGRNIRAGAHYTQFLVYDFDGDGKAEVVCKTADATIDGAGVTIGNGNADYRDEDGYILSGPEYLTVFSGQTGEALTTVNYEPPRGNVSSWGDSYGNRVDRFLACVAYLDGVRPSIVMARGYYTRTVLVAYDWRNGTLTQRWTFDSNDAANAGTAGQGNHNLSVGDTDGDGKDEIHYGALGIDDDGTKLYNTELKHGDAMHLGDLNPNRAGLEVFGVHESTSAQYGAEVHDAETGQVLWGVQTGADTGRGLSADIDPRYIGEEVWASDVGLHSITGEEISSSNPGTINFAIWWDGDLQRELLDHNWNGSTETGVGKIEKWDYENEERTNLLTAEGTLSNNHTKGTPTLQADLIGDWREEVIWRTTDSNALRMYTTTDITAAKIYTLMHDPVYRLGIAWQNVGYNQPPHTSFYLGNGMATAPQPNIFTTPVEPDDNEPPGETVPDIILEGEDLVDADAVTKSSSDITLTTSSTNGVQYLQAYGLESGEWIEFHADIPAAGTYQMSYQYKTNSSGRATVQAYVNGEAKGSAVNQNDSTPDQYTLVDLGQATFASAGSYPIKFVATSSGNVVIDYTKLVKISDDTVSDIVFEGENLVSANAVTKSSTDITLTTSSTNGIQYLQAYGLDSGEWIEFNVDIPAAGTYQTSYQYKTNTSGRATVQAYVNGEAKGSAVNQNASTPDQYTLVDLGQSTFVSAGTYPIRFVATSGGNIVIDFLELSN